MVRLQKFLADAGVASRRAGEKLILDGLVRVNGRIVQVLGTKIDPDRDEVIVDGKIVRAFKKVYIALNKPPGCVCSRQDEHDRPTVYDLLPKEWQIVHSVKLKAEKAVIVSGGRSRTVVELELSEGKNREVRRLFESQAVTVKRLQRIQIGRIKLGELKLGKWRTLTAAEIKTLLS